MSALVVLWCALSLAAAGLVKGVLGIGLPLVSLPLLSLAVPVPVAVALLPIPMLVTNVWQSVGSGYLPYAVRRFWPLLIAVFAGTFIGARMLATVDLARIDTLVGGIVLVFSATVIGQPRLWLPARTEPWLGALAGGMGGVLGGLSGLFGPPILIFLAALGLSKDLFVGCITTIYLCSAVALLGALVEVEVMGGREMISSALAAVPLFAGTLAGERLRGRIDEAVFRRLLLVVLMVSGAQLLWRGLAAGA